MQFPARITEIDGSAKVYIDRVSTKIVSCAHQGYEHAGRTRVMRKVQGVFMDHDTHDTKEFTQRQSVSENIAAPKHGTAETKQHAARRASIIQAARELYEERGLSQTSVQSITDRIEITRTLFYHYFPDKDAVTSAVLDDYIGDYLEALQHWNHGRKKGDIEHALESVVKILRLGIFENDSFRRALASRENSALYLDFLNRVADRTASYIVDTTVQDYSALHEIKIDHIYETFYVLIIGIVGYIRCHPETDDEVLKDIIAQTLHMDRGRGQNDHAAPGEPEETEEITTQH